MKNFIYHFCFSLAAFIGLSHITIAQSTTITPGNNQPALTATSTNNGMIVPQIALTASLASPRPVTNPAAGLLIYNNGSSQTKGFYYWTGTAWQYLITPVPSSTVAPINIQADSIRLNAGTQAGQLLSWNGNNWVNTSPIQPKTLENRQPYLTINFCIATQGIFPSRNGPEPFIAAIALFSFNFAPKGWAQCNGQLMPINQNQALFSLLGTYYGGNGQTTFALPDLRGKVTLGMGQGNGLSNYSMAQQGGVNSVILDNKY